jgi:predicted GNAT superfamily acetyltransferase
MTSLRPFTDADLDPLLALNNANKVELGYLDAAALRALLAESFRVRIIGAMDAFLIGLDQDAVYDSPNFLWFKARFARFAYVDRVVVAPSARGKGFARLLYDDFFAAAAAAGHTDVFCEVNYDPPNPASDAFHARLGFTEIGRATLHDRGKSVRYLQRKL